MSREKDLVKNTFILSVGRFLPKLVSFVTLPILTGRLTKSEMGNYDLITTLIMLVLPIATLQIQSAAFRFLIDTRKDKKKSTEIVTSIFGVTIPISLIVSFIMPFFFASLSISIRILIGIYFFIDTIHLTVGQAVRGLGHNKDYSISSCFSAIVNMIGIFICVQVSDLGILGVMISLVAANLLSTLFLCVRVKLIDYIKWSAFSKETIKELIAFSWPMVPNNLSNWALKLSDRLVITAFLGVEANAVYAVANKVPNILNIAQSIMVMAWQENASIAVKDKDAEGYYTRMLDVCYSFMFGFTALLIAGTPLIFRLLIRGDYNDAYYQIPVLILGSFFYVMSSYVGGIFIAHKKTVNVGVSTMFAAVINLAIDFMLVNVIGITAGSISTLTAYVVLYYYRLIKVQSFQKVRCNMKKQLLQVIIIVAMLIICFIRTPILNIINFIIAFIVFVIFNKEIVKIIIKRVKNKFGK